MADTACTGTLFLCCLYDSGSRHISSDTMVSWVYKETHVFMYLYYKLTN
jgi:hypothetical protein